jgi:hypothetical protein
MVTIWNISLCKPIKASAFRPEEPVKQEIKHAILSYKGRGGRALLKFGVEKWGLQVKNGFNWFGNWSSCNLTLNL